jgi:hypothetical protein
MAKSKKNHIGGTCVMKGETRSTIAINPVILSLDKYAGNW